MNVIIPNIEKFEGLKRAIKKQGYKNLHILSDFDRTLTYGCINGTKTPSIISMLRDGHHLSEEYAQKANVLFDKYHPIEIDPNIFLEEKKKAMTEWWETHNKLLISSGLSKKDLEDIVENGHVKFREGVDDFLDFLHKRNIPLVIMSASGCGDAIQMYFDKAGKDYPNIIYVTNQFVWDKSGLAIGAKEPVIHSMNKDETIFEKIPNVYHRIKDRKNVILLGDNIEDVGMIEGFNYKILMKIGFLNFDEDKLKQKYEEIFDVVLEGDGNFEYVNSLIQEE